MTLIAVAWLSGIGLVACSTVQSFGSPPGASPGTTAAQTAAVESAGAAPASTTSPSSGPVAGAAPRPDAEPVRVVIDKLRIDLPVIRPPRGETFPLCDVAEFLPAYGLPGLPGVTYLYAHARRGMFLPLLEASRIHDGAALIGATVEVETEDGYGRTYRISEVHRAVRSLDVVNAIRFDALVLQTSETSRSTGPKLVIVARAVGEARDLGPGWSPPVPRPRECS
jgi:hypothetical protein